MNQTGLLLKESIKLLVSHLFTKYQVPFFFGGGGDEDVTENRICPLGGLYFERFCV